MKLFLSKNFVHKNIISVQFLLNDSSSKTAQTETRNMCFIDQICDKKNCNFSLNAQSLFNCFAKTELKQTRTT